MIPSLANHVWQSTCFAAAIAVCCYWLRHDGAHVRFWLWWLASVKFLIPFSLLTALGARLALDAPVAFVPETWTLRAELVANPFANAASWSFTSALLAAWLAGSVLLLGRWIAGAARLRAVLAAAEPAPAVTADDGREIRVYRSRAPIEPGIVGLLRPVLLLPEGIERLLSPAQLDAVLRHEISHIQRRDNLAAVAHMLVEVAFWFHPFVWWIGSRLTDERERACDEMVVAAGHDRETYATGILDVCEHFAATRLRSAAGISGSDLKRRITQIMRYQGMSSLKSAKKFLLTLAGFAVLGLPVLSGLALQRTAVAQQNLPAQDAGAPFGSGTSEYLPIVKVAPVYPPRAAARGLEGFVVVEYTVNSNGSTEDVVAIESSSMLFEAAAIESALKFKYKPRIVDGTAVTVEGVRSRIEFVLEGDDDLAVNPDDAAE